MFLSFLKEKARKWLFKEELDKLVDLENKYREMVDLSRKNYGLCETAHKLSAESITRCNAATNELEDCRKLINSIVDVGVDVGYHSDDHSWAVVCVAGKPEYVKFVPLTGQDARGILDYLKHFEYSNKIIDSPFAFKDMVKNYFTK